MDFKLRLRRRRRNKAVFQGLVNTKKSTPSYYITGLPRKWIMDVRAAGKKSRLARRF
uniref:Uncharacterized protein n=1 Tax=Kalanchoe fedtschenkoi TaxID=63787 RepID=A0A7N0ZXG8_KALFE